MFYNGDVNMSEAFKVLTLAFSLMLLSCSNAGPKPDSGYKNALYVKSTTDRFTGVSSCQARRDKTYVNGLMSYNLGFDVTCGDRVTLIGSSALKSGGASYFGVRSDRIGGMCSAALGYSESNKTIQSYWNYGDVRVVSKSVLEFYQDFPSITEVRPDPSAIQSVGFIQEFLNSNQETLYVRLGGHGGVVIKIDRELASKFIDECI